MNRRHFFRSTVGVVATLVGIPVASRALPSAQPLSTLDPILMAIVRRTTPTLIAYDVCGVQPVDGLRDAMRHRYEWRRHTVLSGPKG